MSYVTNVILAFGCVEDERAMMTDVNRFFEKNGLVLVDDDKLPRRWYGGTKMLETNLAIGSFNYLDLDGLLKHLASLQWKYRDGVQLIVKEEHDDVFRIVPIVASVK